MNALYKSQKNVWDRHVKTEHHKSAASSFLNRFEKYPKNDIDEIELQNQMKKLLTLAENESKKTKINNRNQLKKVFDTLITLSANAMPLRGHEKESLDDVFDDMVNKYRVVLLKCHILGVK